MKETLNSPKCEREVTGGTGTKVKVNGKEVAVIGSQVTTCNDVGYGGYLK